MIQNVDISGHHTVVTDDLQKYITKKIGKLDKYMSKHTRKSAHVEVKLSESKAKDKKQNICEAIMHLPHETIAIKEATINMFAAVDIVEAKLKTQLKKYKDTHGNPRFHQRLMTKLRRADPTG
ncbi:MAG: hypothetical protein NVS1B7_5560 [Candidatus Saccharimonadales bacterium]